MKIWSKTNTITNSIGLPHLRRVIEYWSEINPKE